MTNSGEGVIEQRFQPHLGSEALIQKGHIGLMWPFLPMQVNGIDAKDERMLSVGTPPEGSNKSEGPPPPELPFYFGWVLLRRYRPFSPKSVLAATRPVS
jgi:hypothetical protein